MKIMAERLLKSLVLTETMVRTLIIVDVVGQKATATCKSRAAGLGVDTTRWLILAAGRPTREHVLQRCCWLPLALHALMWQPLPESMASTNHGTRNPHQKLIPEVGVRI